MKLVVKLLIFNLLIFILVYGGEVDLSVGKKKSNGIDENTFNYIYEWIYRISNKTYFNMKYFNEGLFKLGKGIFFFDMKCVKDYSGKFFLEIPRTKYIDTSKYKYRYIPISDVDKAFCSKSGEIYRFRVFREVKDRIFDVRHDRVCYLSSLMVCIEGRKRGCVDLTNPSFLCRKNRSG